MSAASACSLILKQLMRLCYYPIFTECESLRVFVLFLFINYFCSTGNSFERTPFQAGKESDGYITRPSEVTREPCVIL